MLYTVQHLKEVIVAVRLNITMDADLYQRLKRELPAKRISRFINDAVRAHLHPDRATLDAAYKAARKEAWRKELAEDWDATETEGWPR
jgi:post-segregation antitoxin (ccd killing protein)